MADWSYSSVLEYERNGNSHNYKDSGNHTDVDGVVSDNDAGSSEFTVGETLTINVGGTDYFGEFAGTYTSSSGELYLVIYQEDSDGDPDTDQAYIFSTLDEAAATADLPNVIDSGDFDTNPYPVCFAAGTLIATPNGERAVETLKAGDLVLTADGKEVAVRWLGAKTMAKIFHPAEHLRPIRMTAGSLGDGLPHSDLTVTNNHAMLLDSVLCHAGAMVNGTTIIRVPLAELGDTFTVYHIETENHEIILANGSPSETFIDNVSRRTFQNHGEYEAFYDKAGDIKELPYPRAMSARQLPASVRQLISEQDAA
ncbi:Hint domain-containing protein [Falsiphaeobacter marinintestinus]|uniref:Hint domain-containing protein n=1 Tax=Falsiphaeobacter marinintestinus TaxID=1492905 RepID=UPI0011B5A7F9|nr:Hint domain-containing protein [Phaeobacter marinintestinus]